MENCKNPMDPPLQCLSHVICKQLCQTDPVPISPILQPEVSIAKTLDKSSEYNMGRSDICVLYSGCGTIS